MNLLQLNTSIFTDDGQSSALANGFVEQWQANKPDTQITVRDFAQAPVPHLTAERFAAFTTAETDRSAEQQAVADYSEELIQELQTADVIVLGLPMYNFGIPSQLKAWIDHVARAGITFRYTENGPEGLLEGKKVYVLAARGGMYQGTAKDTQTGYIRDVFAFLGITDVEFIYAEGLNMGDEPRSKALNAAHQQITALAA